MSLLDHLAGRSRDRIEIAVVINQLATPGLGSWIAGRRLAGAGQLILSCAGFGLFLVFFVLMLRNLWLAAGGDPDVTPPDPRLWQRALGLFGAAWIWSGITSIQMLLDLRRRRREQPPRLPLTEEPPP